MAEPAHRRRFGNYLLDKKMQLHYIAFVIAVSVALFGALSFMAYRQERSESDSLIAFVDIAIAEGDQDPDIRADIVARLGSSDSSLVITMVGAGLGMMVALSVALLFLTHTVAGPIHKVSGYLDDMAKGRLPKVVPLRRGDLLQDFYRRFLDMHEAVSVRKFAEMKALAEFVAVCDQAGLGEHDGLAERFADARRYLARRRVELGLDPG